MLFDMKLISSKLFLRNLPIFLSATFAITDLARGQEQTQNGEEPQNGQEPKKCGTGDEFDPATYNIGFHIGAFFIILFTSSLGAFVPVISKRYPKFALPKAVFFFCRHFGTGVIIATAFIHMIPTSFEALNNNNDCLPKVLRNYTAWPGAIAMMSACAIFLLEFLSIKFTEENEPNLPMHKSEEVSKMDVSHDTVSAISHTHANETLFALSGKTQSVGIIVLEAGICLHSVIIGMALSVATGSDFISLLIALVFHQAFEGLGLGSRIALLEFPDGSFKPWLMSLAYGTTTPIGIAIGLGVHETYSPDSATARVVQGVLDSISAGILLYAALVELLANDFIYDKDFLKKSVTYQSSAFILFLLGAAIMALIGNWA